VAVPQEEVSTLAGSDQEWTERQLVAPVDIPDIREICASAGISLRSMGRTYDEDPLIFKCAAAAGTLACSLHQRSDVLSNEDMK
jgi:hypothetical protein